MASKSVVALWYGFYSVGTAVLLPPLLGIFYPSLRPHARFVPWGMAVSGAVTLAWVLGETYGTSGRPWLGVEPVYVGLVAAGVSHISGAIARRHSSVN
jgi:hypothetical protein